uniref:Ribonuclease H-like domain-containing protein n=1 Tax=Tanacetum cinerariifolium TaxID=118510 RepID=A0A699IFR3_TANCI|nr:ribonuclease H-like domain-containing protein [Tanacetum cinerariifolium]
MKGNKSFLTDYQKINRGFVAFGGSPKGGKILGKGTIRTGKLDFEDVYFVKELMFSLLSVSQICDKKNSVFFIDTECLVLFTDFKLPDENQVLLQVPRQNNMYNFDLKNVVPTGGKARQEKVTNHEYILLPFMPSSTQSSDDKNAGEVSDKGDDGVCKESGINDQENTDSNTQDVGTAEPSINATSTNINTGSLNINNVGSNDPSMPYLEETGIFVVVYDDREVGAEADTNNLELLIVMMIESDEMAEATILLQKTTLAAEAQENIAKVQETLDEEEIERMVKGEVNEDSYASEFADSILNDDVDDFDEVNDDDVEKPDDATKENNNDDHTDHTLVETQATGSMETRNEQMQTPIPSPTRSHRKDLSFDKTTSKELTAIVSPTTATTSKNSSTVKRKKISISYKTKILPGSIADMCRRRGQIRSHIKKKFITHDFFKGKIREVLDHCNKVVPEMTFAKTNEMIKEEMPQLVKLAVDKDREITPINVSELISKEFATHGPKMIEEMF